MWRANVTVLLANVTALLANVTALLANVAALLANVTALLANVAARQSCGSDVRGGVDGTDLVLLALTASTSSYCH